MNRNPIIPYVVIMIFGIGLMFLLSFKGLGDAKEIAAENGAGKEGKTEEVATNPEDIYKKSCLGCHGNQYQGGAGPALKGVGDRLSEDEIKTIVTKGKGTMPKNLVPEEQADEMAKWLAELK